MPDDDVYTIGVDGNVVMPSIPEFTINPFCGGLNPQLVEYSGLQSNQEMLPEGVDFYPDTRQFRFNTDDFTLEGMFEMEMIGAINYYMVPEECPLEEYV